MVAETPRVVSQNTSITSICLKAGETLEDIGDTHGRDETGFSLVNKQGEDHTKEDHSTKETVFRNPHIFLSK